MTERTPKEIRRDKIAELARAESAGEVADSMSVRRDLMAQVREGKITLHQAQCQLALIQHTAAADGKVTREQAYTRA